MASEKSSTGTGLSNAVKGAIGCGAGAKSVPWVNLTRNDKWIGDGLKEKDRMGDVVRLRITFAEQRRATAWVTQELHADNATYSPREKRRRLGFNVRGRNRRRIVTNRRGEATLVVRASLAGGDTFPIKVEDRDGNTLQADNLHTRRKLYFQIIRMNGVAAIGAADVAGMQDEFWNEGQKLYIKMVEHTSGKTIPTRRNLDDTDRAVFRTVRRQARRQYSTSKNPYSFVVLAVRRNGSPAMRPTRPRRPSMRPIPARSGRTLTCSTL